MQLSLSMLIMKAKKTADSWLRESQLSAVFMSIM